MAKCDICAKGVHFGNNVSHSHRRSNAIWNPNVKSVKCKVNGVTVRIDCGILLCEVEIGILVGECDFVGRVVDSVVVYADNEGVLILRALDFLNVIGKLVGYV